MKVIKILALSFFILAIGGYFFSKFYTPPKYSSTAAIANGDIVTIGTKQYNIERLDKFVDNFKNGKSDEIVITSYTVEGDAIISRIIYNGKRIKCTTDASRDKFAGSRSIFKKAAYYETIETNDNKRCTEYNLIKGDTKNTIFLKYKPFN